MDYLWSPWRFRYVSEGVKSEDCVFCELHHQDAARDREHLILHRGRFNFILLNLFPYTTGHVMVAPYAHVANLADLDSSALSEMMGLAQKIESALRASHNPEGYNLGMNLGKSAGAGVADHLHLHILPRWTGDSNFMTVTGETRVLPENLLVTYDKLDSSLRSL
jgi:ATP adenylyltransferase